MRNRRLLVLGLLALLGVTAIAAWQLAGAQEGDVSLVGNGLSTSNRTTLSVCVASPDGAPVSAADVTRVQTALDAGLDETLPTFEEPPYPTTQADVVGGCPSAAVPQGDLVSDQRAREMAVHLRSSDNPSPHRVFVYLVPLDSYETTFGSATYFETAAEMFCEGEHVCGEITTALYMPQTSAALVLEEALMEALGLLPVPPDPTPDWALCEVGTPEPFCDLYKDWKNSQQ